MVDYAGLKAEIALAKYAGMTDAQIAGAIAAEAVTTTIDVPVGDVEGYLRSRMLMGGLQRFVASPPAGASAALVEGLAELLGMLTSPHVQTVQMTNATVAGAVTQILGGAVAASLISAQNETDLLAMSSVTTTRAAQLGLDTAINDIEQEMLAARIWPGVSA